jgi:hypothetical protein
VIVYGVCAGPSGKFDRHAGPSIERLRRPCDEVVVLRGQTSIFDAYNSILDSARTFPDLQGVVLIHDDVELRDMGRTVELLSRPGVGIVGAVGGCGHHLMGWWTAPTKRGRAPDTVSSNDFGGGTYEVDAVDGILLALSPAAVKHLRFDDRRFSGFHGYDADICAQAKASQLRVLVTDIDLFHHCSANFNSSFRSGNFRSYHRTALRWQLKWQKGTTLQRLRWRLRLAAFAVTDR